MAGRSFSPIHLPTMKREYLTRLIDKKVTALAFEYTKDEAGFFPFVRSMSESSGRLIHPHRGRISQ
jgi:alanine dehydrogenase